METSRRSNLTKQRQPKHPKDTEVKVFRFLTHTPERFVYEYRSILFNEYTAKKIASIAMERVNRKAMADRVRVAPSDEGLDIKTV